MKLSYALFFLWTLPVSMSTMQYPPTVSQILPSLGPSAGGTVSTITGYDFSELTTVCRYGGASAQIIKANFKSSTEILCVSPLFNAVQGPVDFAVSNDGGGEFDTGGIRFMYLAPCEIINISAMNLCTFVFRTTHEC